MFDAYHLKRSWPFGECGTEGTPHAPSQSSASNTSANELPEPVSISEFVCYGSLTEIRAQLSRERSCRYRSMGSKAHIFSVTKEGDFFNLTSTEVTLGRLNKQTCRILNALTAENSVSFSATIFDSDWKAAIDQTGDQFVATFDINIYGMKSDAQHVGHILSKSNTFLQYPRIGCHTEYHNPHIFRIEGYSDDMPSGASEVNKISYNTTNHSTTIDEKAGISDTAIVDKILDSLSHETDLGTVTVDSRIRTTLLPHQKEAMDFIHQHEIGSFRSSMSLWKYNDVDGDVPFYQHTFSGAKRPEPSEGTGGIIADEMGLGKSLVLLSTIAGSFDRTKFFVGAKSDSGSQFTNKIRTRATLIVVPSSLLIDSWVDEIRKHSYSSAITFHKHTGSGRHAERDLLQQRMIVLTTYATAAVEFSHGNSSLAQLHWYRIVLDEAHEIRNKSTKQFQAVSALTAEYRWCLTGTPIQNSLEDLGSLVTFLKIPILEHAPTFRKFIIGPITSGSRGRFKNLQLLLQSICLRRTRDRLDLPEPVLSVCRLTMAPHEQAQYSDLLQRCRVDIDMAVSHRRKGNVNSTMLESLLKLRLFCNNGTPPGDPATQVGQVRTDADEVLSLLQQIHRNTCIYCSGVIYSLNGDMDADGGIILAACSHLVCKTCIPNHRARKHRCPGCEAGEEVFVSQNSTLHTTIQHHATSTHRISYPTKLLALLSDLSQHNSNKCIVFSSWKKTLVLAGQLLRYHSIPSSIIDGSLTLTERLNILKDFRSPKGTNILLMTLGTGAVGLNLAVASRIYLLEPQWNPSIESQAIGRALRLGQKDKVTIVRYIMRNTVEESNVLSRQRKKLDLAGGGFGKSRERASAQHQAILDYFGCGPNADTPLCASNGTTLYN